MEDDLKPRMYQDDLDTNKPDEFINEQGLAPTGELGIPENDYKEELDKTELGDLEQGNEDMRETIEDRNEDDDNAASTS